MEKRQSSSITSHRVIQDFKQANSLAQRMIGQYGMKETLKVFYNDNIDSNGGSSPFLIRTEHKRYLTRIPCNGYKKPKDTVRILLENREMIQTLLEKFIMYGHEI